MLAWLNYCYTYSQLWNLLLDSLNKAQVSFHTLNSMLMLLVFDCIWVIFIVRELLLKQATGLLFVTILWFGCCLALFYMPTALYEHSQRLQKWSMLDLLGVFF